jgi:hypothetical protein
MKRLFEPILFTICIMSIAIIGYTIGKNTVPPIIKYDVFLNSKPLCYDCLIKDSGQEVSYTDRNNVMRVWHLYPTK